ncbi:hypothetical protein MalM25_10550 [Planctomycetes bacterium MalM25]|nr:hypothetical protein MalM25_10550 [Planctomycetes bacterium MalM25]
MDSIDPTTAAQKAMVCLTSFSLACLAFVLTVVALMPLSVGLLGFLGASDGVVMSTVMLELFGLPIVAALAGLNVGVRCVVPAK